MNNAEIAFTCLFSSFLHLSEGKNSAFSFHKEEGKRKKKSTDESYPYFSFFL